MKTRKSLFTALLALAIMTVSVFSFVGCSAMIASSNRGNSDSGEVYSAARDLDHSNYDVQNGIISWMNNVLKDVGFVG